MHVGTTACSGVCINHRNAKAGKIHLGGENKKDAWHYFLGLAKNFHFFILPIPWKCIYSWDLHLKMLLQTGITSVKCSQETSGFPFLEA